MCPQRKSLSNHRRTRSLYHWLSEVTGTHACWVEAVDEQDTPVWGFIKRLTGQVYAIVSRRLLLGSLLLAPALLASTQQALAQRSVDLSKLSGPSGFTLSGANSSDRAGWALAVGDINGDGLDDMIIGAPYADVNTNTEAGKIYVMFGRTGGFGSPYDVSVLDGITGFAIDGINATDNAGMAVTSGDINGDGIDDVIIGTPFADSNGNSTAGATYVVFGKTGSFASPVKLSSLNGNTGFTLNGINAGDNSGQAVASGDINGDGVGDVVIGAYDADPNGNSEAGATYVVFGQSSFAGSAVINLSTLNGSTGFALNGVNAGDNSGRSVASGDINGDGVGDVVIGAYTADPNGNNNAGTTYVVFGKTGSFASSVNLSSLNGTSGFALNGVNAGDNSGQAVASGDINGDGKDDVIIGALQADPNGNAEAGETYVIFGQSSFAGSAVINLSTLNGSTGFTLNGVDVNGFSGWAVASGDIDGDGFDDVVIGALGASPNGNYAAGATYVVFGKTGSFVSSFELSSLNGSTGFALNGVSAYTRSGTAVALGDINGDGVSDLLIGAPYATPNGNRFAGEVYVFTQLVENAVITGDEGWRMLAAPVSFSLGALDGLLSPFWIQGATAGADTTAGAANVYLWDPTLDTNSASNSGDWVAVTDLTVPTFPGQGFLFYVFSDDNGPGAGNTGFPKVLSTIDMHIVAAKDAGTVAVTSGLGDGRFFLAGNPFVSTIDWDDAGVSKTNLSNTIYIWDDASSVFQSWNGSVGNIANGRIEPMQSFFTQALGGSGALSIDAAAKTSSQGTFFKTAPDSEHKALKIHAEAGALKTDAWLSFQQGGALARDKYDGLALQSFSSEYIRIATRTGQGDALQINALPLHQSEPLALPLDISGVTGERVAMLSFEGLEAFDDWDMVIHDHQTGQEYPIEEGVRIELDIQAVNAKQVTRPGLPTPVPVKKKASSTRYSISLQPGLSVSTEEPTTLPTEVALDQNFPNPFNPATNIRFTLPEAEQVKLEVFDQLGRKVATLINARRVAGEHTIHFNASALSSGVYIYRLQAGDVVLTRKLTLLK